MNAKGVEQVHGTGSYCTRVMVRFISKDAQAAALDVAFRSSYNFSFFVFHLRPCWMMMPSVVNNMISKIREIIAIQNLLVTLVLS